MNHTDLYNNLEKVVCEKIATSIADFVMKDKLTFFGYFLQNVNFYKSKYIKTAGVNFRGLTMNFYYNEDFINSLTMKQVKFLCLHELFHLLFNHPKRGVGHIHEMANFAMDMIINDILIEKYCSDISSSDGKKILKKSVAEFIPSCVKLDSHYTDEKIFESLYTWINEKFLLWKSIYGDQFKQGLIDSSLSEKSDEPEQKIPWVSYEDISEERKKENEEMGIDESTRRFFEQDFPSFDVHFWDEIPDDIKRDIIQRNIDNLKARGIGTGDSEEVLHKLIKKKNDNVLKLLKRSVSSLKGFSKTNSFRRPSRKELEGLKGKIKESNTINCILDTSGSMMGSFEIVLSEIFKDDYIINMVQCDSDVKSFTSINNKNQLQNMKIKGLGGTILQPGLDYIINNKAINKNNLIILTDGYTDTLDFAKYKSLKVLILSSSQVCPVAGNFKNVTQMIIDNKKSK